MSNEFEHTDLDQLLKERLGDYKETPSAKHWERFERNFSPRLISYRRFKRYRTAFYGGTAAAAILAIMLLLTNIEPEISKKQTGTIQTGQKSAIEPAPGSLNGKTQITTSLKVQAPKEVSPVRIASETGNRHPEAKNAYLSEYIEVATNLEKNDTRGDVRLFAPLSLLKPIDYFANEELHNDSLKSVKNPEVKKVISTPAKTRKNRSPGFIRKSSFKNSLYPKHSSRHNFQANRNRRNSTNPSFLGGILSKLEYKINLTPQYCGQTLNNKGGVVASDFDPKFYRSIENGMFAFSGGLEAVYPVNNSWSIYSGLKMSQFKRETTNGVSQLKTTNGQIAAPTSSGDVFIHGLATNQLSAAANFQTKLILLSAEIPIIARYQAGKYIYLDGGLKYSYIFSGKTQTKLIGDKLPFTFDRISDFSDHNLSLVLGAGFTFITRSGLKFDAGPEICWNVTNLNPASDLVNKPLVFGIRTAISLQRFERN